MNAKNVTYWASTSVLCLLYAASAVFYATQGDKVRELLAALGYPGYLVPILLTVKVLALAAVATRIRVSLSDLAYAGMLYHLSLALSAHLHVADYSGAIPALIGLVTLTSSFLTQNYARDKPSPYAPAR